MDAGMILSLMVVIGVGLGLIMLYLNSRYPKVRFIIRRGNIIESTVIKRLYGGKKLLPNNLLKVAMYGADMIGEDINSFQKYEIKDPFLFFFTKTTSGYEAHECNSALIPQKYETLSELEEKDKQKANIWITQDHLVPIVYDIKKMISFLEIKGARDLAANYINNMENAAELPRKRAPLLEMLYAVVPQLIVIITLMVGLYLFSMLWIEGQERIYDKMLAAESCGISQPQENQTQTHGDSWLNDVAEQVKPGFVLCAHGCGLS